jgi:hypothetical protein
VVGKSSAQCLDLKKIQPQTEENTICYPFQDKAKWSYQRLVPCLKSKLSSRLEGEIF